MTTVELHQAFIFTCEDCGRDTFVRAVVVSPESVAGREIARAAAEATAVVNEAMEALGLGGDGQWLMAPERVTCGHCGAEFAVEEP